MSVFRATFLINENLEAVTKKSRNPKSVTVMSSPHRPCPPRTQLTPRRLTAAQVPTHQGLGEDHLSAPQHAAPARVRGGASAPCRGGRERRVPSDPGPALRGSLCADDPLTPREMTSRSPRQGRCVNKSQRNRTSDTREETSAPRVKQRVGAGVPGVQQARGRGGGARRCTAGAERQSACRHGLGSTRVAPPCTAVLLDRQQHRPRRGEPLSSALTAAGCHQPPCPGVQRADLRTASPAQRLQPHLGPSRSERAPEVSDKPATGCGPGAGRCPQLPSSADRQQPPEEGLKETDRLLVPASGPGSPTGGGQAHRQGHSEESWLERSLLFRAQNQEQDPQGQLRGASRASQLQPGPSV